MAIVWKPVSRSHFGGWRPVLLPHCQLRPRSDTNGTSACIAMIESEGQRKVAA
jgi:hypothetical protein